MLRILELSVNKSRFATQGPEAPLTLHSSCAEATARHENITTGISLVVPDEHAGYRQSDDF